MIKIVMKKKTYNLQTDTVEDIYFINGAWRTQQQLLDMLESINGSSTRI